MVLFLQHFLAHIGKKILGLRYGSPIHGSRNGKKFCLKRQMRVFCWRGFPHIVQT